MLATALVKSRSFRRPIMWTATALIAMSAASTVAAKTLKVSYYIGEKHSLVSAGIAPFMEEIKNAGVNLDFRVFPAGQLGKPGDSIKSLQSGLADIALIVVTYHREEMPLSQVVNLPWDGAGAWDNTNAFMHAIMEPGPIADEWKQQNLVPLIVATNPPYEIHTASKPLPNLAAANGLKLRSPGGSYNEVLQVVGANPVAVPTPEAYESISRGTVDGTVYAFSNWSSLRLGEILKHTTTNVSLPSPGGLTYAISRKTFDSLTPEQRAALLKAGHAASIRAQTDLLSANEAALAKYKNEGLNTYEWPQADLDALQTKYADIRANWVKNINDSGRPGTETAKKFGERIIKAKTDPKNLPLPQAQ